MSTRKPDDAHPESRWPFTSAAPVPPGAVPDNEVTQVMPTPPAAKPAAGAGPAPGGERIALNLPPPPPGFVDAEATQVMMPPAGGLSPAGAGAARPPLSLPPRQGAEPPPTVGGWPLPPAGGTAGSDPFAFPPPAPAPLSAFAQPLPPAPAVDPSEEATRVLPQPMDFLARPPAPPAPSHPATHFPPAAHPATAFPPPPRAPDPLLPGDEPPVVAPTIAVAGYEPTMIIKGGDKAADKPRTMTLPEIPPKRNRGATLPGLDAPAADGSMQQVGRYLIRERLGRGGMATVFRAHDPTLNRDVAIKFLHASLCADDEYRDRFLREARAAGGLSHPNIVVVHDVGEIDGRPYMAMELIDGTSLADEVEAQKVMPIRDVVVMGMQLARALDYAHGKGIVHRDIKPGNIMRLKASHTIKVMDFGIAHVEEVGDAQHTRVGDVLGTPQYMSPEQANGEKLDGRSDLFSAGIVLYQMLTGKRPFRGDTLVAVATRIATEDPTPINKQRPEVPASLRRVIDRCLAKQPANRFQSGKELSDALSKVLNELDEVALAKSRPRIVPLRVKWAATMALIVAVVMGLTTAVITQRQYAAMMNQVSDYGASLARFIAQQNAASVLGDDWAAVEVAVSEVMKTGNFERVTVIDPSGVVRVSSQAALVGQPYKPEGAESLGKLAGTAASRYLVQGDPVLGFEAPILFQDKQVGRVALGIPERPLTQVARLSISLMVVLAVVTVLAVAIAMYFVANWFAKPIQLVADSMVEIGKGRFDHRINEQRKDEFGQLYAAFDSMAQALQDRATAGLDPASPPTQVPRRGGPETQRHRPG